METLVDPVIVDVTFDPAHYNRNCGCILRDSSRNQETLFTPRKSRTVTQQGNSVAEPISREQAEFSSLTKLFDNHIAEIKTANAKGYASTSAQAIRSYKAFTPRRRSSVTTV